MTETRRTGRLDVDSAALRITGETSFDHDDAILEWRVDVTPGGNEDEKPIGHFDVWRFNIGAYVNSRIGDLWELFDAHTGETADLYNILFDGEEDDWKPGLFQYGPDGSDLIYLQWAEFPASLRRSKLVLRATERIIDVLGGGCGLAALWPWDNPPPKKEELTPDRLLQFFEGQEDNEAYWGRLGFRRFENSSVLVRDLALVPPILGDA